MLVGVESFSKFARETLLKNKSGTETCIALENIFLMFIPPTIQHTDNGKEFVNFSIVTLCEEFRIRHVRSRARCPWVQGQVERLNKTIKFSIFSLCQSLNIPGQWIKDYKKVIYKYNNIIHATTRKGLMEVRFGSGPHCGFADYVDSNIVKALFHELGAEDAQGLLLPEPTNFSSS
ncbi:Pol polyprotein [Cucumispora dikerogammari]|nr:Pol polyprotein [Cucumispora dikerogammari]